MISHQTNPQQTPISAALADFVAGLSYADLPKQVSLVERRALLDALGVMLGASYIEPACKAFARVAAAPGDGLCTLIGTHSRATSQMAALSNGALAHALDFEDTHEPSLMHPNAAVIPAALAIAEERGGISGDRFLAALVAGSEVVCRLGLALKSNPLTLGWYIPPILCAFGATASVCNLLSLSAAQTLNAFGLCLYQTTCSAEFLHSPHSSLRAVRDGFASRAGVLSALLAEQGLHGVELPFEGQAGVFALYAAGQYDPAVVLNNLGNVFECADISFKAWPSCRGTHPYIQAALSLRARHANLKESATRIVVEVAVDSVTRSLVEPLARKRAPQTAIDAKFSVPFCVATALVYGDVNLSHFSPDALGDPLVLAVSALVQPIFVPATDARKQSVTGTVRIVTPTASFEQTVTELYGSPAAPLSDADLLLKYHACVGPLTADASGPVVPAGEEIMNLHKLPDIRLLFRPGIETI